MVTLKKSFREEKIILQLASFIWKTLGSLNEKTSNVINLSVHENISSERKCIIELIKSSLISLPKVPPARCWF